MISKRFKGLTRRDVYHRIFEILNYAQNDRDTKLTTSEIRILTEFMLLSKDDKGMLYRFSLGNRKKVLELYNGRYGQILNNRNLNGILTNLRKKGLVIRDNDGMNYLSPYIENKILGKDKFEVSIGFEDIMEEYDNNSNER
jgi:hypothetical protein